MCIVDLYDEKIQGVAYNLLGKLQYFNNGQTYFYKLCSTPLIFLEVRDVNFSAIFKIVLLVKFKVQIL